MTRLQVTQHRATFVGSTAILMWSTLALLTDWSGDLPPFQLTAIAFSIAFLVAFLQWIATGQPILRQFRLPLHAWGLGLFGLFGYHFFYFMALSHAPAVEASLIAYLWPLLIVLFSAFLPQEHLRGFHVLGAIAGFLGAVLLVTKGRAVSLNSDYIVGYLAALICAVTWSSYSILSRRFGSIPTQAIGCFCGLTAVLAWVCHGLFETTVWPTGLQWLAILALGIGPVGLAFFTWDYGVKRGNIRVLGALSYAAPLLSTLLLIRFGRASFEWTLILACLLIVGGAILASQELWGGFVRTVLRRRGH
jgi:drug/metabolite transporter (DMT)-like permease